MALESRYGIYFIPPSANAFYDAGSRILGYDIRCRKIISCGDPLPRSSCIFPSGTAFHFGFHATIRGTFKTYDLEYLYNHLESISTEVSPVALETSFLESFNERNRSICFRLSSTSMQDLMKLHGRILHIVDKCRQRDYISPETKEITPTLTDRQLRLLQAHGDPRVLDEYIIHFTLANNASPEQLAVVDGLIQSNETTLCGISVLLDRLCLVSQEGDDPYWRIVSELELGKRGN